MAKRTPEQQIAWDESRLAKLRAGLLPKVTVALAPVPVVEWAGCYDQNWTGIISSSSFTHPAKMSRALLVRIYDYLFEIGAVRRGDTVVDPFGGIGSTGIEGAGRGLHVVCNELELRFHLLMKENFQAHHHRWETLGLPQPVATHGDSRRLREIINGSASAIVASPPYAEIASGAGGLNTKPAREGQQGGRSAAAPSQDTDQRYGDTVGQLARLEKGEVDAIIGSPPYAEGLGHGGGSSARPPDANLDGMRAGYGETAGQLEKLSTGSVDAIVSSPPFLDNGANLGDTSPEGGRRQEISERSITRKDAYGTSDGNIAGMEAGSVSAIISSPPFGGNQEQPVTGQVSKGARELGVRQAMALAGRVPLDSQQSSPGNLAAQPMVDITAILSSPPFEASLSGRGACPKTRPDGSAFGQGRSIDLADYGTTEGQIGAESGETFWSASRLIISECFALLRPGGYAVWVTKRFVKGGQIVPFDTDWRKLCEHCGFETLTEVRAMLVKETRETDLFGEERVTRTKKASFFRRMAEARGAPPIDWETCWIMRKPL